jgi:hypothetical protein
MSTPEDEFGNIEVVLKGWLDPLVTARVVSELPGDLVGQLPVIQVVRASGDDPRTFMATDRAVVDVDVWHGDRTSSSSLAETVRRYFRRDLPGTTTGGFVFMWVTTIVAPRWQPDPNTNVRRMTATYEVGLHPA